MRWPIWGIAGTVAVHLGVAAFIAYIPKDAGKKSHLIAVVEKRKKKEDKKKDDDEQKKPEEPPPPKAVTAPRPKPKPAPEAAPPPPPNPQAAAVAAAHPALAALPDLGISMAGGPGGVGGIAVPMGPAGGDPGAAKAADAPKAAARPKQEECSEPEVKPKSVPISQAGIIAAAQAAGGVEGRIRLELQIDEGGNVTSVRVLSGLGGAIDAAAVAAARRAKVTPITRCGRPVAGRLVYAMTIRNPD